MPETGPRCVYIEYFTFVNNKLIIVMIFPIFYCRIAVEDWIKSKEKVHIMRDHVNHCFPINGGMWGGIKGALPYMKDRLDAWSRKYVMF
jgi:hypothetical protein